MKKLNSKVLFVTTFFFKCTDLGIKKVLQLELQD